MISPKVTFAADKPLSKGWQDVVDGKQFQAAATAAFAQMELDQPASGDMQAAAARAWMLQGAKVYLKTLTGLTAPPEEAAKKPDPRFNPRA